MKNSIVAYLVSIGLMLSITLIYFKPQIFNGKRIYQADLRQFEGMTKQAMDYYHKTKQVAFWNVAMFSGMPNYITGVLPSARAEYPSRLIYLFPIITLPESLFAPAVFLHVLMYSFLGLLCFGVRPIWAALGAICFALGTHTIILIEVGHSTKLEAIATSALILGGIHLVFTKKWWLGALAIIIGTIRNMQAEHAQMTFYLFWVVLIFVGVETYFLIKERQFKTAVFSLGISALAGGLGALSNIGGILMTKEYGKYTMRGGSELSESVSSEQSNRTADGLEKDYAFEWSQGIGETFTLVVPYWYGGSSSERLQKGLETYQLLERVVGKNRMKEIEKSFRLPFYHGDQRFTAGPLYAGVVLVFLFVLGMFILETRTRYWMLGGALICMMFAWGRNLAWFNYFLFDYVPLFNKFRSVSMALGITLLIIPVGAFITLQKLIDAEKLSDELKKRLIYATTGFLGLFVLLWFATNFIEYSTPSDEATVASIFGNDNKQLIELMVNALYSDRKNLARYDIFRSFVLVALSAGMIYLAFIGKLPRQYAWATVVTLAIGDLFLVGKRYLNYDDFIKNPREQAHTASPADLKILADTSYYRVFNIQNPFNEANTSYFHKSVGGYSPVKMSRYQDLIEKAITPELSRFVEDAQKGNLQFESYYIFNMLNTKYFKYGDRENDVILNPAHYGAAWFVSSLETVGSPNEEMQKLLSINTKTSAVIDTSKFSVSATSFQVDSTASIRLLYRENPNKMVYETNNIFPSFVVFSEVYYPDWQVKVDEKPTKLVRVNYVLRGLELPAGKHLVEMEFVPTYFYKMTLLTKIGGWLAFAFIGFCLFMIVLENKKIITSPQTK
ncbi:MAG: YfhO family protein [Cytophagales bacterium]|nr:YfhO family protein [Cytophagales bacterium]MDW8383921.1 YfhO family protein [Flammeovirgaceae bacterium]